MVSDGDPALKEYSLIGNSNYGSMLFPYHQRFGDQLKVIVLDDVRENPYQVYEDVLRFIGADPTFVPRQLDKVMWSDRQSVRATGHAHLSASPAHLPTSAAASTSSSR
jgi:hypothetical protein